MRRLLSSTAVALASAAALAAPAAASPVKCKGGDATPGDRVFPEARVSTNFLRFDEFECGVALLERRYRKKIETTVVGSSEGGHPLYDILLTDERVPAARKRKLLVVSSIHGDEVGGREGAVRVLEDMVDPRFLAEEPWVEDVLEQYVIHFLFPNADGWVKGDVIGTPGAGALATRGNQGGTDLNRQFPVKGWIDTANRTLQEPEGNAVIDALFRSGGWYLGTDNHGQLADTYAAAGLQIVGQFDYQKSETLARFADGITESMKAYGVLGDLERLREATGQDLGAYHWGTLYDMLGYSASGSMIDYYNTADGVNGTGFATELTVGREQNWLIYPAELNQVWVDSIRAINYTMFRQAVDPKRFTFDVGSRAGYVFDPARIRHDDADGFGEGGGKEPYDVSRMEFFADLNDDASRPLRKVRVTDVLSGRQDLDGLESLVLADDAMPEGGDRAAWFSKLEAWLRDGGNLIVTDAAATGLAELGLVDAAAITEVPRYVGYVDFTNRTDPLTQDLRGVARQTYDTVPIGYQFGSAAARHSAPNWRVQQTAWEAKGGRTLGTNGSGQTVYGELPVGKGKVRFLGALLPDPTEEFFHPYGLQNYAVTYTGYTLLQNMLRYERPGTGAAARSRLAKPRSRAGKRSVRRVAAAGARR